MKHGSIIAAIITAHMPRNVAAAPSHVCPGIRIHAIDIVQPPGIGISPTADMGSQQMIVAVTLAAKSSAETLRNACCANRSEAMRVISPILLIAPRQQQCHSALAVLIMATPPDARLVAS